MSSQNSTIQKDKFIKYASKFLIKHGYDDLFQKQSHTEKTLLKHIHEIIYLGKILLKHFKLDKEEYLEFFWFLSFFHDLGKLQKDWRLDYIKRPPHSKESILILLKFIENKLIKKDNIKFNPELIWILIYFIAKHHGTLKKEILNVPLQNDKKSFDLTEKEILKGIENHKKSIDLVDIFGVFKLCDSISASSKSVEDLENLVYKITKSIQFSPKDFSNIFNKKLDKIRWKEQLKLTKTSSPAILQAPTGWGKTTSSILFSYKKSIKRVFYILPTITAIRDFSTKLQKALGKDNVESYFYFYEIDKINENEFDAETLFLIENFLKPVIITTIDQFLLTFFQVGKYHTKRVAFKNSLIIIDEIHLLSTKMLKFFINFFKKYEKIYNLKLLIMSATLPKAFVDLLKKELQIKDENHLNFIKKENAKLRVKLRYKKTNIQDNLSAIIKSYKKGKKVLVIVNTVDKAIDLEKKLSREIKEKKDLIIFHSRFIYKHRLEKEKQILKEMSKKTHILVCTQIAEVSLDISYDLLFTELAPFASLVQRFGRVNRYGKNKVEDPNCFIFYPDEIEKKKFYPYLKEEINLSEKLIKEITNKNINSDYQIYQIINRILDKKEFEKRFSYSDFDFGFNFEAWENVYKYFFSLSFTEEEAQSLLRYRDEFSALTLLDESMIEDDEIRLRMQKTLAYLKNPFDNYVAKRKFYADLKLLTIPVPLYLLRKAKDIKGFPIINIKDYKYNYYYGLHKIEVSDIIL